MERSMKAPAARGGRRAVAVALALLGLASLALGAHFCQGQAFTTAGRVPGAVSPLGLGRGLSMPADAPKQAQAQPAAAGTSPLAYLAVGAVIGLALQSIRSGSAVTRFGGHDKKTFRGKKHFHTVGLCRLNPRKRNRLKRIKAGLPKCAPPKPEPAHTWDDPVLARNKMFGGRMCVSDLQMYFQYEEKWVQELRADWKNRMGIKGKQWPFLNWTPPGQEPKPEPVEPKTPPPAPPAPEPEAPPAAEAAPEEPPKAPEPEPPAPEPEPPAPEPEEKPADEPKEEPPAPKEEPKEEPPAPKEEPKEEAKPEEPPAPEPEPEAKEEPPAPEPEAKAEEPAKEEPAPAPEPEAKEEPPAPEPEAPAPEPEAKEEPPAPEPEPPAPEAKAEEPKAEEPPAPEPEAPKEEVKAEAAPAPVEEKPAEEAAPAPEAKAEEPAKKPAGGISAADVKALRERSRAGILDCKKALKETDGDMDAAMDWLRKKGIAKADKKAGNVAVEGNIASYVHFNSKLAVLVEINSETDFVASNAIFKEFTADVAMQLAANPNVTCITSDDVPQEVKDKEKALEMQKEDLAGKPDNIKEKMVEGRLKKKFDDMALLNQKYIKDEDKTVGEVLKERIAKLGENIIIRRFVRLNLGEGLEKKDDDFAAGVEKELAKYRQDPAAAKEEEKPKEEPKAEEKPKEEPKAEEKPKEEKPKVAVSAAQVKELRQRSGAGIMDSKKALAESGGDMEAAMEWLKKKGMAKADKKAGNVSVEGAIAAYVHFNSKLGVIVEVNSETDFVAINAIFKEFTEDVAMQIAANPAVVSISADDVPAELVEKEREIEMNREDLADKPEQIRAKIVEGRLKKKYEEVALLSQKWLKDESKTVQEVLKEKIAKLGENIVIRRFERLVLGEGLEKKDDDFAAGVEAELAKYRS